MKVLVLNCGSSSIKYQLINMKNDNVLASGKYERIGEKESFIVHKALGKKIQIQNTALNHKEAIDFTLKQLVNEEYKVIDSLNEIDAIGHRFVHGGEKFTKSVVVSDTVVKDLEKVVNMAPLHNPASILGIKACLEVVPNKPMVIVFDTAFHQTIAKDKFLYPIPYSFYEKHGIRKYGFHGTSHNYVAQRYAEITGKTLEGTKIVTCHLGQGSSICAVKDGKSVDTSMGLTPLGGISMVTRSGDLDPSVVTSIMKNTGLSAEETENLLNKQSGVQGICGLAPDFREIEIEANNGHELAEVALENFKYSIAGFIAKYAICMGGLDTIIFTGGIGENQIKVREDICNKLAFMGVKVDETLNNSRGEDKKISKTDSNVEIYIIPTNEELMIARETVDLI